MLGAWTGGPFCWDQSRRMSSLIIRNLQLGGHRTGVRLEGAMWDALNEIADRESTSINQICTWADGHRAETGFTSSLRILSSIISAVPRAAMRRISRAPRKSIRPYRTSARTSGKVTIDASVDMTMAAAMSSGSRW